MRLRFWSRRERTTDAVPMGMNAAWSPEEQIRELRMGMAGLYHQVARLEGIIAAAGIAKRQQAGWVIESSKDVKAVFLPDSPSESGNEQFVPVGLASERMRG